MTIPADPLQTAVAHHRAGRLLEAAKIYRQILTVNPRHADAMHLLGLVAHHRQDYEQAIRLFSGAIRVSGSTAVYHDNLGESCRAVGRLSDAKASYRRAISLDPNLNLPHLHLALVHRAEGDGQATADRCRAAIALQPNEKEAHRLLAATLTALGDSSGAQDSYQRLLAIDPVDLEALVRLGTLFGEAKQYDRARQQYVQVLSIQPNTAHWHVCLGDLDAAEGQWQTAISRYQTATRLDSQLVVAQMQLATALQATGDLEAAVTHYRRAVELSPSHVTARFNLGTALASLGRHAEAADEYSAVLKINPDFTDAHLNLGSHYQEQQRDFRRALDHYDAALKLEPDSARAHFNRALIWLTEANLAAGWPEFEWRLKIAGFPGRSFDRPRWTGAQDAQRTLLLHSEQGLGDTFQFVRYLPMARQRVGRAVLLVQPPLVPLLQQSGFDDVFGDELDLPHFDDQAPLLSLPAILGTTLESIPADIPYLSADPRLVETWRERLQDVSGFRVGICWQGAASQLSDPQRSIPLDAFGPLAEIADVRLVSLQKGDGEQQLGELAGRFRIRELGDDWDESAGPFMDTAAVMQNLDLVISVDSSVAHLAGGLGVPVWVALAAHADWRWLLDREDTPWYSSMRLFRQSGQDGWAEVFARIVAALCDLAAVRPAPDANTPAD